jgi:CelD/BcsL family acetyltransferase involved in cellulose biosynthesis
MPYQEPSPDPGQGQPEFIFSRFDREDLIKPLEAEWDDLVKHTGGTASQSYAYAMRAWETTCDDSLQLNVITSRFGGRLVGVWPLYVFLDERGIRIVRHLGCGGAEEYAGPLIGSDLVKMALPDDGPARLVLGMYEIATALGDVLEIYNTPDRSILQNIVHKVERRPRFGRSTTSPIVRCSEGRSWDDWFAAKSKSFRDGRKQDRKRLQRLGNLAFREVSADDAKRHVDWFFDAKAHWLDERGIQASWLRGQPIRDFYSGLVGKAEGVEGFALDLDGRTIAGCICLRSGAALEFYVTAFDPDFARYSPGNVMIEDLVKWCIARKLDFDFRITNDPYKLRWADGAISTETISVACTKKGVGLVRRRRNQYYVTQAKIWIKERIKRIKKS